MEIKLDLSPLKLNVVTFSGIFSVILHSVWRRHLEHTQHSTNRRHRFFFPILSLNSWWTFCVKWNQTWPCMPEYTEPSSVFNSYRTQESTEKNIRNIRTSATVGVSLKWIQQRTQWCNMSFSTWVFVQQIFCIALYCAPSVFFQYFLLMGSSNYIHLCHMVVPSFNQLLWR